MRPHRIKITATALGLTAIALYAVGAVALNVMVDTDQLRAWLAPRASTVLNRPVSVGEARVALLPRPSIHVRDVRVDNLGSFDGPVLAFVERARFDLSWLPLLVGRVEIGRVRLDGPRIYLGVQEDGTSNFGDLLPSRGEATELPTAPVSFLADEIEVSDASLAYFDAPAERSFTISGAVARVTLRPEGQSGWRADVSADSDSLLVRLATLSDEVLHLEGPSLTLTARGDDGGRAIDVEDGELALDGETLSVSGRLAGLAGPRPTYDLQLANAELDAAVLAATLPLQTRSTLMPHTDGTLAVTLQVTGAHASGEQPIVRGSLRLDGVRARMNGKVMVSELDGTIGLTPDTVFLDSLTGVFADGPFELSGTVARDTRALALRTRARPDLDALDRLELVPEGATLSGDAALDVSVTGSLDTPDSLEVAGVARLTGFQAKHVRFGVPLYVPAGEVAFAGRDVSWSDLQILIGEDAIVTSGQASGLLAYSGTDELPPVVDISIRGPGLDLGALFPLAEDAPETTYARLALEELGGRSIDHRAPAAVMAELGLSRPGSLPARGWVALELDTLDFRAYHLESLTATVELGDSTLVVDAPAFTVWGGAASGSLTLGVGTAPEGPFSLTLHTDGASAEELLAATTPLGGAVSGTMDIDLAVAGRMGAALLPSRSNLSGRAELSIRDGRVHDTGPNLVVADFLASDEWRDVPFDRWDTRLEIIDRRLEIDSSEMTGPRGHVVMSGLLHLDGSHDLSVGLSIPSDRLASVSLRRTGIGQSVLDHLTAARSPLDLGLRMSGVLWAPVLEPDASNALALAR